MRRRLTKDEYEALVLEALHRYLTERDHGLRFDGTIIVEEIRLDVSGPKHMLEILFRDDARRRCLFGWRFPATEVDADALEGVEHLARWEEDVRDPEQAKAWARAIVLTNFEEQIQAAGLGLPEECDPDRITWVGDCKP